MNFKKLFVLVPLILMLVALSACSTITKPVYDCQLKASILIDDPERNTFFSKDYQLKYDWLETTDNSGNKGYSMKFTNISELSGDIESLNAKIDTYNKLISPLFGGGLVSITPGIDQISLSGYMAGGKVYSIMPTGCGINSSYTEQMHSEMQDGLGAYDNKYNIVGDRVFVTITSPAGSLVKYSFPLKLLDTAFDQAFRSNGQLVMPSGQLQTMEITADQASTTADMLQNMMTENGSIESVYFSFNADDFEGRRVLKPVIARALEISAGEYDVPVVAMLNGYGTSGYKSITSVTAQGDELNVHGWMVLGTGNVNSSGGDFTYSSNTQTTLEDMVKGSIYLTPVQ